MAKMINNIKEEVNWNHNSTNSNAEKISKKVIKLNWITLKLSVFLFLFSVAVTTKLLREILHRFVCGLDYLTKLGSDDIDGKITRLFETIKRVGRNFSKI